MMPPDGARCRWHAADGRCTGAQAFPGGDGVPELCVRHLAGLEAWIAARATRRGAEARDWINWARRQAEEVDSVRRALGDLPPRRRVA
ncbi:MAG: hypothetical protein ACRDNZ_24050 [Streptosporangiaceae bacterium]